MVPEMVKGRIVSEKGLKLLERLNRVLKFQSPSDDAHPQFRCHEVVRAVKKHFSELHRAEVVDGWFGSPPSTTFLDCTSER